MKTRKLFDIVALIAIMGALAFTACPHDAGDNNGGGNNNNPGSGTNTGGKDGSTITETVTGIVPAGVTDFSYVEDGIKYVPINNYIPNSSVTVIGGKVTLKLGVPNTLTSVLQFQSGVTANPSDAKLGDADDFYTSDGKYELTLNPVVNISTFIALIYADKDVTITGQFTNSSGYLIKYNMPMKAGWNYVIGEENGTTVTFTSSTSLPSGYSWQVIQNPKWQGALYLTSWKMSDDSFYITFKNNQTFTLTEIGTTYTYYDGTYSLSGNTLTLIFYQGQAYTGTYIGTVSGNTLTINGVGTFTKIY